MIKKIIIITESNKEYIISSKDSINKIRFPPDIEYDELSIRDVLIKKYFALLDELRENVETGYKKPEFNLSVKKHLIPKMKDNLALFVDNKYEISLRHLTEEGLKYLIDLLILLAKDTFNYEFKKQNTHD